MDNNLEVREAILRIGKELFDTMDDEDKRELAEDSVKIVILEDTIKFLASIKAAKTTLGDLCNIYDPEAQDLIDTVLNDIRKKAEEVLDNVLKK